MSKKGKPNKGNVTRSNPSSLNWFRNVGKSLGYTSSELITSMMPTTMEFVSSNADTVQELYSNVTDLRSQGSRIDSYFNQNKQLSLGRSMLKNAFDDIKSGKIYNKERQEALYANDDLDDFDFGDDDFSFSDDLSDDNFQSSETSIEKGTANDKSNTTINNKVTNVKNVSTPIMPSNANPQLVKAIAGQTQVIADAAQAVNESNIGMYNANTFVFQKFNANLMTGMDTINENLSLLVNFHSDSMTKYIGGSLKYYEDNLNVLGETLTVLKEGFSINHQSTEDEIKKNKSQKIDADELFSGGMDIKSYMNLMKGNLSNTLSSNPFLAPIKMMWEDTDTMEFMFASPLSFISNKIVKNIIPEMLTSTMEEFDKTFTSFFPALMMKINRLSINDNPLIQILGDVFGFKTKRKTSADISMYEKGKVPFDGITKKAITEVIPGYLRKILSAITGKEEVAFDFNKGQFQSMFKMSKEFNSEKDRQVLSSFREALDAINERTRAIGMDDVEYKKTFTDEVKKFFISLSDKDYLVNPELRKDKEGRVIDELKDVYQFSDASMQNLFRGIIDTLPKEMKMNMFGRNVMDSRSSLTKFMDEIEKNPELQNYNLIRNGLGFDGNLKRNAKTEKYEVKKGSGLGDVLDKFGKNSLDYLRDIASMLAGGIKVIGSFGDSGDTPIVNPNAKYTKKYKQDKTKLMDKELKEQRRQYRPADANKISRMREEGVTYIDNYELAEKDHNEISDMVNTYMDVQKAKERPDDEKTVTDYIRKFIYKDGNTANGFNNFSDMIKNIASKPAKLLADVMTKLDNTMYSVIFGKDDDPQQMSFFNKTFLMLQKNVNNFGIWMKTKFFDPIKDALFGDDGFFTKIKKSDMYTNLTTKFKGFLKTSFGEKGWFSGIGDEFRDVFNYIGYAFSGKEYTDSKGGKHPNNPNSIVGNMKSTFSKVGDNLNTYLFGKGDSGDGKGVFGNIFDGFKSGMQNFNNAIFGPKGMDGKGTKVKETVSEMTEKVKKAFPKSAAWGILGAGAGTLVAGSGGLGLLGSLFLPGGPIGFGIMGMAGGFLSQSDKFKNWLFGDLDSNGARMGGVISKGAMSFFAKNKAALIGGAALGAIKPMLGFGLLPSFFLPGGIVGGALTGLAGSMLYRSEGFQKMLFGELNADGVKIGGLFNKLYQGTALYKGMIGNVGVGALGGAAFSGVVGQMGVLGAMLTPGGIIGGALLGAAAGIALSSEKWKTALFGNFDEKEQKRKGGMLGKFTNWFTLEVQEPLKLKLEEINLNMQTWFTKSIANPFKDALAPIKTEFSYMTEQMKQMFYRSWESFQGFLGNTFEKFVGKPFGEFMEQNILNPLKKFFSGILNIGGKIIGSVVKAPFSLLQGYSSHLVEKQEARGLKFERDSAKNRFKTGTDDEGNKSSRAKSAMDVMGLYFSKTKKDDAKHGEHGAKYYRDWVAEKNKRDEEQDAFFDSKRKDIEDRKSKLQSNRDLGRKHDYDDYETEKDKNGKAVLDENGNPVYTDNYIGSIYDVWGNRKKRQEERAKRLAEQEKADQEPDVEPQVPTKLSRAEKKAEKEKNRKLNNPKDPAEAIVAQSTRLYEVLTESNENDNQIIDAINEGNENTIEIVDDVISAMQISVEQGNETNSILSKILNTLSNGTENIHQKFFGLNDKENVDMPEVETKIVSQFVDKMTTKLSNHNDKLIVAISSMVEGFKKSKDNEDAVSNIEVEQSEKQSDGSPEPAFDVVYENEKSNKRHETVSYSRDIETVDDGNVLSSILKHVIGIHGAVEGQLDGVGSNVYKMRKMMGKILNMDDDVEGSANRDRGGFFGRMMSFIKRPMLAIKEAMIQPFLKIGEVMHKVGDMAKSAMGAIMSVPGKILDAASSALSVVGDIAVNIGGVLKTTAIELVKIPGKIIGVMGDVAEAFVHLFKDAIVPAIGNITKGITSMIGGAMSGLGHLASKIGKTVGSTIELVGTTAVKFAGKIGELGIDLISGLGKVAGNTINGISSVLTASIKGFSKIATTTITSITSFTADTLKFAVNTVKDTASAMFNIITSPVKFLANKLGKGHKVREEVYVLGGNLDSVKKIETIGFNNTDDVTKDKSVMEVSIVESRCVPIRICKDAESDFEALQDVMLGKMSGLRFDVTSSEPLRVIIADTEKPLDVNGNSESTQGNSGRSSGGGNVTSGSSKSSSDVASRMVDNVVDKLGDRLPTKDAIKGQTGKIIDFAKSKAAKYLGGGKAEAEPASKGGQLALPAPKAQLALPAPKGLAVAAPSQASNLPAVAGSKLPSILGGDKGKKGIGKTLGNAALGLISKGAKALTKGAKDVMESGITNKAKADKQAAHQAVVTQNKEFASRKTSNFVIAQNDEIRAKQAELEWKNSMLTGVLGIEANTRQHEEGYRRMFGIRGLLTMLALGLLPKLKEILKELFGGIDRTDRDGSTITNTNLVESLTTGALKGLKELWERTPQLLKETFENALRGLKELPGRIIKSFDDAIKGFRSTFDNIFKKVTGVFDNVASKFSGSFDNIAKKFSSSFDNIVGKFSGTVDNVVNKLLPSASVVGNVLKLDTPKLPGTASGSALDNILKLPGSSAGSNNTSYIDDILKLPPPGGSHADDILKGGSNIRVNGNMIEGVEYTVREAQESLFQKFMNAADDALGKMVSFLDNKIPGASKAMGKMSGKFKSLRSMGSKVMKSFAPKITVGLSKLAGSVISFGLSDAGFATYGAVTGFMEAERLFKVPSSQVDIFMKTISAAFKAFLNVSWFFVIDILNEIFVAFFGVDFLMMLADAVYGAVASDLKVEELQQARDTFDKQREAYNQMHGTDISMDAWNDKMNRTWWQKYVSDPLRTGKKYLYGEDILKDYINEDGVVVSETEKGKSLWERTKQLFTGKKDSTQIQNSLGEDYTLNTNEGNILQRMWRGLFGGEITGTKVDNKTGEVSAYSEVVSSFPEKLMDNIYRWLGFDNGSDKVTLWERIGHWLGLDPDGDGSGSIWTKMTSWLGLDNFQEGNLFSRIGRWLGFGNDPDNGEISIWGKISGWLGFGNGDQNTGDTIWTRIGKWLGIGNDESAGEISIWKRIGKWLGFGNDPDNGEISIWGKLSGWLGFSNIEADNIWVRISKWLGFGNDRENGELSIWERIAGWLGFKGEGTVSIWDKLQGWLGLKDVENTMSIWDRMYSWMGFDDENSFMYKLANSKAADLVKGIFGIGTDDEGNERQNIITRGWNKLFGKDKNKDESVQIDASSLSADELNNAAYKYLIQQMNPDLDMSMLGDFEITPQVKEQVEKLLGSKGINVNDTINSLLSNPDGMSQITDMLGFLSNMDKLDSGNGKKSWWEKTKEFFGGSKKDEDDTDTDSTDKEEGSFLSRLWEKAKSGTSSALDMIDGGYGKMGKLLGFTDDPNDISMWDWISNKLGFGDGTEEGGMNIFTRVGKWLGFEDTSEEVNIWERLSSFLGFGDGTEEGGETLWTKINRRVFGGVDEEGNYQQSLWAKMKVKVFGFEADEDGRVPSLFSKIKQKVFGYEDEEGNYHQSLWDKVKMKLFGMDSDEDGRVGSLMHKFKLTVLGGEDEEGNYQQSLWAKMKVKVFGMEADEDGRVGSLWKSLKTKLFGAEPEETDGEKESLWSRFKKNVLGAEKNENGETESIWDSLRRKTGVYEKNEQGEFRSLWDSFKIRTLGSDVNEGDKVDSLWTTFKKRIFGSEVNEETGEVDSLWMTIKKKTGIYKEDEDGNELTITDRIMSKLGLDLKPRDKDSKTLPDIVAKAKESIFGAFTDEGVMKNFNMAEGTEENITTGMRIISKFAEGASVVTGGKLDVNEVANVLNGMWLSANELVDLGKEKVIAGWESIKNNISETMSPIVEKAKETWDTIKTNVSEGWNTVKTNISDTLSPVIETAKEKWDTIKTNISEGWDNIKTAAAEKLDNAKTAAYEKWEDIKGNISTGWDNIKTAAVEKLDNAKTAAYEKWEDIKSGITTGWDNIKTAIGEKLSPIVEAASTKWDEIKSKTEDIWEGIKTKMVNLKNSFVESLGKAWDNMMAPVTSVIDWVKDKFTFFKRKSEEDTGKGGYGAGEGGYGKGGEYTGVGKGGFEPTDQAKVTMKTRPIEDDTCKPGSVCDLTSAGGSYNGSTYSTEMPDKLQNFAYYSQADKRWGNHIYGLSSGYSNSSMTMASRGCGPTALSMVLTNLTGKRYLPTQIADYSRDRGYSVDAGTGWGLFTKAAQDWDMDVDTVGKSAQNIRNSLTSGKPIVLSGTRPGGSSRDSSPFTTGGHLVTAVGTDGNSRILINDPRGVSETKSYDLNTVVSQMSQGWAYKYKNSGKTLPNSNGSFDASANNSTNDSNSNNSSNTTKRKEMNVLDAFGLLSKNMQNYVNNVIYGKNEELDLSAYYASDNTAENSNSSNANGSYNTDGKVFYVDGIPIGTKPLAGTYDRYNSVFNNSGAKYGVEPALLKAVSMQESGGNVNADNGYALGLMQIEHTLADEFAAFGRNYEGKSYTLSDRADPNKAIPFAANRFASDISHYSGDYLKAIQAYNFSKYSLDMLIRRYPNDWMDHRGKMGSINGTGMANYGDKNYIEHVLRYYHGNIIKNRGAGKGESAGKGEEFIPQLEPIKSLKQMKNEGHKVNTMPSPQTAVGMGDADKKQGSVIPNFKGKHTSDSYSEPKGGAVMAAKTKPITEEDLKPAGKGESTSMASNKLVDSMQKASDTMTSTLKDMPTLDDKFKNNSSRVSSFIKSDTSSITKDETIVLLNKAVDILSSIDMNSKNISNNTGKLCEKEYSVSVHNSSQQNNDGNSNVNLNASSTPINVAVGGSNSPSNMMHIGGNKENKNYNLAKQIARGIK